MTLRKSFVAPSGLTPEERAHLGKMKSAEFQLRSLLGISKSTAGFFQKPFNNIVQAQIKLSDIKIRDYLPEEQEAAAKELIESVRQLSEKRKDLDAAILTYSKENNIPRSKSPTYESTLDLNIVVTTPNGRTKPFSF